MKTFYIVFTNDPITSFLGFLYVFGSKLKILLI